MISLAEIPKPDHHQNLFNWSLVRAICLQTWAKSNKIPHWEQTLTFQNWLFPHSDLTVITVMLLTSHWWNKKEAEMYWGYWFCCADSLSSSSSFCSPLLAFYSLSFSFLFSYALLSCKPFPSSPLFFSVGVAISVSRLRFADTHKIRLAIKWFFLSKD